MLPSNSLGKERDRPTTPSTGRTFHDTTGFVDVALHGVTADRLEDVRIETVDVGVPGQRQRLAAFSPCLPGGQAAERGSAGPPTTISRMCVGSALMPMTVHPSKIPVSSCLHCSIVVNRS